MAVSELEQERERVGLPPDGPDRPAPSIADRAQAFHELTEEEVETLFPSGAVDGNDKTSLKNLVRAGESVEVVARMKPTRVPLRGGLVDPRQDGTVVVHFEAGTYHPTPQRSGAPGERKLTGWKVVCDLAPTFVEPIKGRYWSLEEVLSILEEFGISRSANKVAEVLGVEIRP